MIAATGAAGAGLIATALGLVRAPGAVQGIAVGLVVLAVLVLTAVAPVMRRFARPMDDLVDAAGRIERGDYSARVREYGPRELRSVARAFNSMSARLKTTDEQRRSFLADVVHELRTPLSVIRAQAEAIADGLYPADAEHLAPIVDATHSLEVLVEDLRALALTDTGSLALKREPVDPADLVRDAVAAFGGRAEAAGVALGHDVPDRLPIVDVDPARIRSAIGNLIANAIRHTPAGGSVRVSAATPRDGLVAISVVDTGEGIAPELLPHVFERFVKGPGSKGSGLGLAIAHDMVVAHGGTIEARSSVGDGTTVEMTLPVVEG